MYQVLWVSTCTEKYCYNLNKTRVLSRRENWIMENRYKPISENPSKDGKYLVKFYNPYMHETDRTEIVWRDFYHKGFSICCLGR